MSLNALVVDDNFFNRDLARLALEHKSFEVAEADDGKQALAMLSIEDFAVMLLDLAMPNIDGITVLRQLPQHNNNENMKIIVMTANPHMVDNYVRANADHVLFKPLNLRSLGDILDSI